MKMFIALVIFLLPGTCSAQEGVSKSTAAPNVPPQVHASTLTYKLHNGPALIMQYVPVASSTTVVSTAAVVSAPEKKAAATMVTAAKKPAKK